MSGLLVGRRAAALERTSHADEMPASSNRLAAADRRERRRDAVAALDRLGLGFDS